MNFAPEFLRGYRALDLTGLSGQLCGRILADLGMEVIKVEPPGGDPVRKLGAGIETANGSLNFVFAHLNANKSSLVLDLSKAAGRDEFLRLVGTADVVIEMPAPADGTVIPSRPVEVRMVEAAVAVEQPVATAQPIAQSEGS